MARRTEKKDRKALIALLLLLIAIAIIIGVALAFFSDMIPITFNGTAGTVTIEAELNDGSQQYYTVAGTLESQALDLDNLNPGDYIVLEFDVENTGSKSAWVRAEIDEDSWDITLNNADYTEADSDLWDAGELKDVFKLYAVPSAILTALEAETDPTERKAIMDAYIADLVDESETPELATTANAVLLDGSDEFDTGTAPATPKTETTLYYILWFNSAADNPLQGADVTFDVAVKALQYRNLSGTTGTGTVAEWATVKAATITLP